MAEAQLNQQEEAPMAVDAGEQQRKKRPVLKDLDYFCCLRTPIIGGQVGARTSGQQLLQLVSIINFLYFVAVNQLRKKMNKENPKLLTKTLDQVQKLFKGVQNGLDLHLLSHSHILPGDVYKLTLEHDIDIERGFLFDAALEQLVPVHLVRSLFPISFRIYVERYQVLYHYGGDCISALVDKKQNYPWSPCMMRKDPLPWDCRSMTRSCREAAHSVGQNPNRSFEGNTRCPRT